MRTEIEIRQEGVQALLKALGDIDAERFFSIIQKEPFDYTQWQQDLWTDESVAAISSRASTYRRKRGSV